MQNVVQWNLKLVLRTLFYSGLLKPVPKCWFSRRSFEIGKLQNVHESAGNCPKHRDNAEKKSGVFSGDPTPERIENLLKVSGETSSFCMCPGKSNPESSKLCLEYVLAQVPVEQCIPVHFTAAWGQYHKLYQNTNIDQAVTHIATYLWTCMSWSSHTVDTCWRRESLGRLQSSSTSTPLRNSASSYTEFTGRAKEDTLEYIGLG